ncbi:UbiD family decarboxylase [Paenibacillus aurantiacus]|uniref:UbiD family decarboxylase n=1 Tax=Paenibacillus aurantiacus TaxID=1936118 RepID=A0ABV5KMF2_9BACL
MEAQVEAHVRSAQDVRDLRSAMALLARSGAGPICVSEPIEARCKLAAVYAAHGAGVPVAGPAQIGPALLFERIMPADKRALVGLFASRRDCALMLGTDERRMAETVLRAANHPIPAAPAERPACQEIIRRDVRLDELPIPTMTESDAGPFVTLGLVMASHPVTGERNVSIHRMWVKDIDELTIWMVPGRDLERFHLAARELGRPLAVSINIGLDPAVYIASCCTGALAPPGTDELAIAGGLRGRPVAVGACVSVDANCISDAEYVLEGLFTHEYAPEGEPGGCSMPEFLGYDGKAHPNLPVIRVTAVTHRANPIYQTVIGPGAEQSNLLAFGMEAAILKFIREHIAPIAVNAYCSTAGGGQLLAFIQLRKRGVQDDGVARQAGAAVISAFRMVKQIVLVDEDVDLFNEQDVWWAMATRFQADADMIVIPSVQGFPLDPSQQPGLSPGITAPGLTSKAVFDCTVPYLYRETFRRTSFSANLF